MKPSPAISDLESHIGYLLRFVSNHVSYAFKLKVESHGVTVAEWVVLRTLFDRENVHPSDLAASIGLTRGAVSKLVDRLVVKRLIECRAGKPDRRFQVVRLTAQGRKLVPVLAALADDNDREFFGDLGEAQQSELVRVLKEVCRRRELKGVPAE